MSLTSRFFLWEKWTTIKLSFGKGNVKMKKLSILISFMIGTSVFADEEKEKNFANLAGLSLEELMRVEVVSIATGKQQSIADAPAVTKVITEKDIEAIGATDLSEVLATVAGFHVARSKFLYSPVYTVRGVYSGQYNPQVLFLINGSPVSTLYTGGKGFSQGIMPIKNIARIEIMKSPGSAIYGADALAAVVNIITKQKTDILGTEIGAKIESFNTQNAWILHSNHLKGSDLALSIEYLKTDGDQSIIEQDYQTTLDKLLGTKASLTPAPIQRGSKTLNANLSISKNNLKLYANMLLQRDLESGIGTNEILDLTGKMDLNQYLVDLTYHNDKLSNNWEVIAKATYFYFGFHNPTYQTLFPAGAKSFTVSYPEGSLVYIGSNEYRGSLGFDVFYKGWKNHILRMGTGYQHANLYNIKQIMNMIIDERGFFVPINGWNDVSNTPFAFSLTGIRRNNYFFVQDSYKFLEDYELTAGIRYDKYSDFGAVTNPRAALVWKTSPELTVKLLYGKAFRAPALFELYGRANPLGLGNPNLQPERIETTELAFDYHPSQAIKLGLNLFKFKVDNGIGYIPFSSINSRVITSNKGKQNGNGFELEMRGRILKNLVLTGHYAFTKTEELDPPASAGNIPHPKHSAYLRTDWVITNNWYLSQQVNWIGSRKRGFNDPRSDLKGYALFDLNLNYRLRASWHLNAGIKNIFNADAREPSPGPNNRGILAIPHDYPLAGRTFSLEMHAYF
jgi:outer membrane receptor for ferrienterochelin and colicin